MLLAIDVGNTNVVLGVFDGETMVESWRLATDNKRSADEYGTIIDSMFNRQGIKPEDINDIIISSVVPSLLFTLEHMCLKFYNKNPIVIETGIKTGLKIKYDDPRQVGADRIVNCVAAHNRYGGNLIVIDFGTATTLSCVSALLCLSIRQSSRMLISRFRASSFARPPQKQCRQDSFMDIWDLPSIWWIA